MARAEVLVAEVHEELAHISVRVAEIEMELARMAEVREELTRIATERGELRVAQGREDLAPTPAIWASSIRELGLRLMMSRARNAATDTDEFDSLVEQLLDMGFDMEQIARTITDLCVSGATFLDTNLVINSMITGGDEDVDGDDGDRYWVAHIVVDVAVAESRPPDDFICAVCLDTPTRMSDVASIMGCTHKFCYDCINTWAERSNKCPCCNMRFHTIERSCM
jgi:hypothetical protein